jgi:hypothetical protein
MGFGEGMTNDNPIDLFELIEFSCIWFKIISELGNGNFFIIANQ